MTKNEEHKHWVDRERIVESLAEIREMHDETCIDRVAVVHLRPNGEIIFLDVHPEEFRDQIPSEVWRGRVVSLDFGIGTFPSAVADWLEEYIEEIETICAGLRVFYDGSNHVGQLSEAAQAAREQLRVARANLNDYFFEYLYIVRYRPEDYFDVSADDDFIGLKTEDDVRQWARDAVANGEPFDDCDLRQRIIIDVDDAIEWALYMWHDLNQTDED